MDYTGENGGLIDERPMLRLPPLVRFQVDHYNSRPDEWDLQREQTQLVLAGWHSISYSVSYQWKEMVYRVEWWGHR